MKRNLTVVCVLAGLCAAAFAAVAALGFAYRLYPVGAVGCVTALVALWYLIGSILRERTYLRFEKLFAAKDYAGAAGVLDRASRNFAFYPVYRIIVLQLYVKAYLALDDTAQAAKCADCLRSMGGTGWKYRTAFFVTIVNLDWEDLPAAQAEYEEFARSCADSAIYRDQLEILGAVFAHIGGQDAPLPEVAKKSPYPVVHRVIRKYC